MFALLKMAKFCARLARYHGAPHLKPSGIEKGLQNFSRLLIGRRQLYLQGRPDSWKKIKGAYSGFAPSLKDMTPSFAIIIVCTTIFILENSFYQSPAVPYFS